MKPLTCSISKCEGYVELKKATGTLRKCLLEVAGKDCIEEEGNNRNRRFRYVGKDDDPLRDMRNAKAIKDLGKKICFVSKIDNEEIKIKILNEINL